VICQEKSQSSGALIRCVANDAKLVSVWISKVSAIVVFVVFRPQARRTFRRTAKRESGFVRGVNDASTRSAESHHLTVAWIGYIAVIRMADDKVRPRLAGTVPPCPRTSRFVPPQLQAKCCHDAAVKAERALEVCDTDEDVGEQTERTFGGFGEA
jgi:hypothetical protein